METKIIKIWNSEIIPGATMSNSWQLIKPIPKGGVALVINDTQIQFQELKQLLIRLDTIESKFGNNTANIIGSHAQTDSSHQFQEKDIFHKQLDMV